jgi:hypothetical protein
MTNQRMREGLKIVGLLAMVLLWLVVTWPPSDAIIELGDGMTVTGRELTVMVAFIVAIFAAFWVGLSLGNQGH